jgi:hypothetical protein
MKIEGFKNTVVPPSRPMYSLGQNQTNAPIQQSQGSVKRNTIALNDKILIILSGGYMSQMYCFDFYLLKTKFLKRES